MSILVPSYREVIHLSHRKDRAEIHQDDIRNEKLFIYFKGETQWRESDGSWDVVPESGGRVAEVELKYELNQFSPNWH